MTEVASAALPNIDSGPTGTAIGHPAQARKAGVPTALWLARRMLRVFLNPYVQLSLGSLLVTASELLMKKGASDLPAGAVGWLGMGALRSWWTWGGIVTYVLSFLSWIYVLRFVPLGIAFALISVVHVLIPLGAWVFLHEDVSPRRWTGICMVLCGLLLILKPAVKAEQRL